jgi:hypothetical protein
MNGRFPLLALMLAACLAGCASRGNYPSLAPRPAEREDWTEEPVHAAPAVTNDAALRTRIAALLAEAREGARAFEADRPAAERAAAHSGAEGSDGWIEAQQAISRLQASRGKTDDAVTELHQLRVARSGQPTSTADLAALDAAIEEAGAIAERQQRQMDRVNPR